MGIQGPSPALHPNTSDSTAVSQGWTLSTGLAGGDAAAWGHSGPESWVMGLPFAVWKMTIVWEVSVWRGGRIWGDQCTYTRGTTTSTFSSGQFGRNFQKTDLNQQERPRTASEPVHSTVRNCSALMFVSGTR